MKIDIYGVIKARLQLIYRYSSEEVEKLLDKYDRMIADRISGGDYNAKGLADSIASSEGK